MNFREENNVKVDWFFYLSQLYTHTTFLTPTNTWLWLCVCVWVCGLVYVCKLLTQFSRTPSEVCVVTGLKTVCCLPSPSLWPENLAELSGGDTGRKKGRRCQNRSGYLKVPERAQTVTLLSLRSQAGFIGKPLSRILTFCNRSNHRSDLFKGIQRQNFISVFIATSQ